MSYFPGSSGQGPATGGGLNPITAAPAGTALTGIETFGVSQGGVDRALPAAAVAAYVLATITSAAPVQLPTSAIYQRDTRTGSLFGQGAGTIAWSVGVSIGGSPLFYRLRDATAVGNPVLAGPTQILGSAAVGTQTVPVSVPCGPYWYFVDWRSGAAGLWALGTQRFAVGEVLAIAGQSLADRLLHEFTGLTIASAGVSPPSLHSLFATWYDPVANGPLYTSALSWGQSGDGLALNSAFPGQLAARWLTSSGVPIAVIGFAQGVTGIDTWQPGAGDYTALQTVLAAAGGRFGTFFWFQGHNDSQTGMSSATYAARLTTLIAQLKADFPASAATLKVLVATIPNIVSTIWGTSAQIEAIRQGAISYCSANASFATHITPLDIPLFQDGTHETQAGAAQIADHLFRAMRGALGLDVSGDLGPRLTGVGTRAAGSRVIRLSVAQSGGTASVATPDLATAVNQFQVFPSGTISGTLPLASMALPSGTEIDLTLASLPLDNVALGVRYRMPPDASATVYSSGLYDNNVADGLPRGRQLQMYVGEITIPAPAGSAVAPGSIGALVAGVATSSTIASSYTGASGTAPIAYAGQTSIDNSSWISNSGSFGPTGGTFTGLSASTRYFVRIVATNAAGSSTTALSNSVITAAAVQVSAGPSLPPVGPTPVAPLVHLDASTLSGAAGSAISTVPDMTGNGNGYGQAVVAKQPLLQLAAVNGLNALRFVNASNTILSSLASSWLNGLNNTDITVILVTKLLNPTPGGTGVGFYIGDNVGANGMFTFEDWSGTSSSFAARVVAGGDTFAGPSDIAPQTLGKKIIRWTESASSYSYLLNSLPELMSGVGLNATTWTNASIGNYPRAGNFTPDMLFCEFSLWPAVATNAQRDTLMAYMTNKWGS